MKSIREELKKLGIELESRYLIYKTQEKITVIPYYHIRSLELKGTKIFIQTGGVERMVIDIPNQSLAMELFNELLIHIERVYL
ncbi:MAG: hypothetical protein ACK4FY_06675 [Aquificaceae bacterium]